MKRRFILVLVFLVIALGLAHVLEKEMKKMNGGDTGIGTVIAEDAGGFRQAIEKSIEDVIDLAKEYLL